MLVLAIGFFVLALANADGSRYPDGTIACDPVLRPVVISTSGTTITSPNFAVGGPYPPNSHCEYSIQAPEGFGIEIGFTAFNVQECGFNCTCDWVQVFARADGSGPSLDIFCGERSVPFIRYAGEGALLVFHSDGATEAAGWSALVNFNNDPACSVGEIRVDDGVIMSPNFPGLYPNRQDCKWLLYPPGPDYVVELVFSDFDVEVGGCPGSVWDWVNFVGVVDPASGEENLYGTWHGANPAPTVGTLVSRPGETFTRLEFFSDASVQAGGFNCSFKFVLDSARTNSKYLQ